MALYVRQAAWLDAVPERDEKDKRPANTVSRRKALEDKGGAIEMPSLTCGDYLVNFLYEVGPTMAAGMGAGPLTYSEIEAWQRANGIELIPWESALMRRLSCEYASESHAATKRDRPAPFAGAAPARRSVQSEIERKLNSFLA